LTNSLPSFVMKRHKKYLILRSTVFLAIFSVFFANSYEVVALIRGTLSSQSIALTPWYLKGLKDFSFLLIVALTVTYTLFEGHISKRALICSALWTVAILPSFFLSSSKIPLFFLASGIRWVFPILLPAFLFYKLDHHFMTKLAKITIILFTAHFAVQIYQMFFMSSWYGINKWGFPSRLPGMFLIPNTAAYFNILTLIFLTTFCSKKLVRFFPPVILLSTFFTASGTGMITMFLYAMFMLIKRLPGFKRNIGITLCLLAPLVVFLGLSFIEIMFSSRGTNYVEISLGTRINIFINALSSGFISDSMGLATNTGVLLSNLTQTDLSVMIVDNFYASVLMNLGYWGALCLGIIVFIYSKPLFGKKTTDQRYSYSLFLVVIGIFSFSTITSEVFPVNLLISAYIAYFCAPRSLSALSLGKASTELLPRNWTRA